MKVRAITIGTSFISLFNCVCMYHIRKYHAGQMKVSALVHHLFPYSIVVSVLHQKISSGINFKTFFSNQTFNKNNMPSSSFKITVSFLTNSIGIFISTIGSAPRSHPPPDVASYVHKDLLAKWSSCSWPPSCRIGWGHRRFWVLPSTNSGCQQNYNSLDLRSK